MDREKFSSVLKKYRIRALLSQKELANKINVDPSVISRIEGGKNDPSLNTAMKLAQVLEIGAGEFFEEKEKEGGIQENQLTTRISVLEEQVKILCEIIKEKL